MKLNWESIDFNKPMRGVYWVVVETHGVDVDCDDDGTARCAAPTGELERHVALVRIENDPDDPDYEGPEIEAVNSWETGKGVTDCIFTTVKLIAPFEMPECPLPTKEKCENGCY